MLDWQPREEMAERPSNSPTGRKVDVVGKKGKKKELNAELNKNLD